MSEKDKNVKCRDLNKYDYVPPDGGWGYMVCIGMSIIFATTTMFTGCLGMMYNDFIVEAGLDSASVTLLSGIYSVAVAIAGFFTSSLLAVLSLRKLAFVAAVLFNIGTFGTVFMKTLFVFFLCGGALQGIGTGVLYNLACTLLNDYFVQKRMLTMSFIQTTSGLLAMVAPIFVKWALQEYGSRGTLLLIGGLSLHNFFAVLIMHPVQWHMKKVEVQLENAEIELLLEESGGKKVTTTVNKLTDLEENIRKDLAEKDEKKSSFRKVVDTLLDTSVFKTFVLSCASIGPALAITADGIYMLIVPQYFYSIGWSQESVAMVIVSYGFGDLGTRVVFIFVSKWMSKIGIQRVYIVGLFIAVISRLGMLWSGSMTATMAFFTMTGVSHCSIAVLLPLVIVETMSAEKFTSAMGISQILSGVLSISLGPAVGAIRDITNSYSTAFYTLISFYAVIAILWPIELIVKSNKEKRKKNSMNSKTSQSNKVPE